MHSQWTSSRSISAASKLPYDILQEIFSHCLPDSPLGEVQPNTRIAPMLLCHICSSWRIAALQSPYLWAYLYYRLPLCWEDGRPVAWDSQIFLRDMECLKWWRQNQGMKAPFIRFALYQLEESTGTQLHGLALTHDDIQFFIEYLTSAQYLDVGRFALYVLQQNPIYCSFPASCLNLQSSVTRYPDSDENKNKPWLVPFHITPTLRRLHLHRTQLLPDYKKTFAHWSGLTHLSLNTMFMFPDVWFSFIRAVPNLQWGYFDIFLELTDDEYDPSQFTLPYLNMLSVTLDSSHDDEEDLLGQLLMNLHLPALRDLSIYIDTNPGSLPADATRINNALKSTAEITKLTLAFQFFDYIERGDLQSSWEEVYKLSTLTPHLTHLVLDMCFMHAGLQYEGTLSSRLAHWKEFLRPKRWLDLASPTNTLCKISAIVREPSRDGPLVEGAIRGALELHAHDKETKVVLEIIPEARQALSPYAEGSWGYSF